MLNLQEFDIYPKTQPCESGLGIGVRALLSFGSADELLGNLVPDIISTTLSQLVYVETSDNKLPLTGLILPKGTFEIGTESVTFFARAEQLGSRAVKLSYGLAQSFELGDVLWVNDSGGAYWTGPLSHDA